MEYKVLVAGAGGFLETNFEEAASKLSEKVNMFLAQGWQLQGGVAVGETQTTKEPYLLQAIVWT